MELSQALWSMNMKQFTKPKLKKFAEARIMYLPNRKRPLLCISEGNQYCASYNPVASFVSEDAAKAFVRLLNDGNRIVSEIDV